MAGFLEGFAKGALRQGNYLFDLKRAKQYEADKMRMELVSKAAMQALDEYPTIVAEETARAQGYDAMYKLHGGDAAEHWLNTGEGASSAMDGYQGLGSYNPQHKERARAKIDAARQSALGFFKGMPGIDMTQIESMLPMPSYFEAQQPMPTDPRGMESIPTVDGEGMSLPAGPADPSTGRADWIGTTVAGQPDIKAIEKEVGFSIAQAMNSTLTQKEMITSDPSGNFLMFTQPNVSAIHGKLKQVATNAYLTDYSKPGRGEKSTLSYTPYVNDALKYYQMSKAYLTFFYLDKIKAVRAQEVMDNGEAVTQYKPGAVQEQILADLASPEFTPDMFPLLYEKALKEIGINPRVVQFIVENDAIRNDYIDGKLVMAPDGVYVPNADGTVDDDAENLMGYSPY